MLRRQSTPAHGGRARRLRRGLLVLAILLVALVIAVFAVAWYASGQLIAVRHVTESYPLRAIAIDASRRRIVLDTGPDATEPGTFRLAWRGGHATVGQVLAETQATVTRQLFAVHGALSAGERVGIEPNPYTGDPRSALGLKFSSVPVPTALGAMPAWYAPGRRSTWVILIHGLGGSRTDTLPAMPTLHALGYPILAISYRNDVAAPRSPDHHSHLGATEWHDVAAAIAYAIGHHASGTVLYGYSLGGAMALIAARDSRISSEIRAIVLDSPVLDWHATLDYAARRRGIPHIFVQLTEAMLAWRDNVSYAQLDQLQHERQLRAPVLLFQGSADTVVPPGLAGRFAHARPRLVTYVPVAGADHVSAIDTDPSVYRRALRQFLANWP